MSKQKGPNINDQITAPKVRLIDEHGEMHGVVPLEAAMERAANAGIDLVEVSPNADPPVCKVMDFGKFKYEEQKKKSEQKKKQKVVQLKEIKLRPTIDPHDFEIKMKRVYKFLEEGHKVKFSIRFRGREMMHRDLGRQLMDRVKELTAEQAKVEQEPRQEGQQMIMIIGTHQA